MLPIYAARLREAQELIVHVALEAARLGDGDGMPRVRLQILIGRACERIAAIMGHDWANWPDAAQLSFEFEIRPPQGDWPPDLSGNPRS
jgi:hypothetical protein